MIKIYNPTLLLLTLGLTACGGSGDRAQNQVPQSVSASKIDAVSPKKVSTNRVVEFTLAGTNLTSNMSVSLLNCEGLRQKSSTTTQIKFECTPKKAASGTLQVKDSVGNLIFRTNIEFEYTPIQPERPFIGYNYINDPLGFLNRNDIYSFLLAPDKKPLNIDGYQKSSLALMTDLIVESYSLRQSQWELDPFVHLVFNSAQNKWIRTKKDSQVIEGPAGTAGVKTLYSVSDSGIQYLTVLESDISNKTFLQEFGELVAGAGTSTPNEVKNQRFSYGAKAYKFVRDGLTPAYELFVTNYNFSNTISLEAIFTCQKTNAPCDTQAASLNEAISKQGWMVNIASNALIRLKGNNQAEMLINDPISLSTRVHMIEYRLINATSGNPARIVFDVTETTAKKDLSDYFRINTIQLAWYEYDGHVYAGTYLAPSLEGQAVSYMYNKTAINDILTKWSPNRSAVVN